jgi:hypothetical protein
LARPVAGQRCRSLPPFDGAKLRKDHGRCTTQTGVVIAVDPRRLKPQPVEPPMRRIVPIAVAIAVLTIGVYALSQVSVAVCAIKGNISASGECICQPGQHYCNKTRINSSKGERRFCSEQEAIAAGCRRAKV